MTDIIIKAMIAAGIAAGVWFGIINPYNNWIRKPAVEAALVQERAVTTPVFNDLTTNFNGLTKQFKTIETNIIETRKQAKADADAAIAKEKFRADQATSRYQSQVRLNKEWATERQAIYVDFTKLPDSMWNLADISAATVADDCGGASGVCLSGYVRRLFKRYESCERDLNRALATAARAVDRAAERGAAVEALTRHDMPAPTVDPQP